jgi:hypothetical protein
MHTYIGNVATLFVQVLVLALYYSGIHVDIPALLFFTYAYFFLYYNVNNALYYVVYIGNLPGVIKQITRVCAMCYLFVNCVTSTRHATCLHVVRMLHCKHTRKLCTGNVNT